MGVSPNATRYATQSNLKPVGRSSSSSGSLPPKRPPPSLPSTGLAAAGFLARFYTRPHARPPLRPAAAGPAAAWSRPAVAPLSAPLLSLIGRGRPRPKIPATAYARTNTPARWSASVNVACLSPSGAMYLRGVRAHALIRDGNRTRSARCRGTGAPSLLQFQKTAGASTPHIQQARRQQFIPTARAAPHARGAKRAQ